MKICPFRPSCRPSRAAVTKTSLNAWLDLLSINADRDDATEFFNSMVPDGVTRGVVRERDRTAAAGRAAWRGLQPDRRRLRRNRRARSHRHVAARHPPAARHDRSSAVARRRRREALDRRRAASPVAASPTSSSRSATSSSTRSISTCGCRAGDVFVAETAEGVTALVLLGDGTMVVHAGAVGGAPAAEALRRHRDARDAVHRGLRAPQPVRVRRAAERQAVRADDAGSACAAARAARSSTKR